jgi:hypothetical protein
MWSSLCNFVLDVRIGRLLANVVDSTDRMAYLTRQQLRDVKRFSCYASPLGVGYVLPCEPAVGADQRALFPMAVERAGVRRMRRIPFD